MAAFIPVIAGVGILAGTIEMPWERNARKAREREREARAAEQRAREAERQALEEAGRQRTLLELGVPPDREISDTDIQTGRSEVGYEQGCRNIVLVGNRGAGKSTLINCLRGLGPGDSGLAEVGEVNVTTDCHKYDDLPKKGKQIVLYDMPGAGVIGSSAWDYYYARKLYSFDIVVIVHETTLAESDVRLRRLCYLRQQHCILVRTKADVHIGNIEYRKQCTIAAARDDYMDQVRMDMRGFNALDSARAPGELRVEIFDYVVNQRALLWKITQVLDPERLCEPPASDLYHPINEAEFLGEIGMLSG
ncbi:P-loop containing nucleoside triphosphate hydrolase protein [Lasiosphaeria hispida]|uniref:P-loop containing nucleoside triphosphate hydrolase protein n=1 Tax=Lasiosphaeria hispida TaxID=260671 RepID=A0AAJ0HT16_9PEZI|nr:P-loop containing nucleoside triphosphate hydrolase protein [Lasiosphaeria hispida]